MNDYPFPGPDPKFEPCGRPDAIIFRLQKGVALEPGETAHFLDWLIYAARVQINQSIDPLQADSSPPILQHPLTGKCEFSQAVISYGLEDLGISHHCFSVDLIYADLFRRNASFKHVGVAINIRPTEGEQVFLLDPTFRQFCWPQHVGYYGSECPGSILAKEPHGQGLMAQLLYDDGWLELSPPMAQLYLKSFSSPSWAFTPPMDRALSYFTSPPAHCEKREFQRCTVKNYPLCNP